jgi:hypothetical protein
MLYLPIRLRELGYEDLAELVTRRKLLLPDRLFRRLEEFVADEVAAQHPRSEVEGDSTAAERPGVPSVPAIPRLPVQGS